jgi:1-acyl-sn-glycerol-3-phosphate acyltransferase
MNKTIFNTPVLTSIMRGISHVLLRINGWKTVGNLPVVSRYLIIVAPHTSNMDLFYGIIVALVMRLDGRFLAKKELFRFPFGGIMRWLGGVPIDRSSSMNTVDQAVSAFNAHERFILAIAPEGTRKRTRQWKSGFYHIAAGAHVPILLGFIDYPSRRAGAGPLLMPSGDIDSDMKIIRDFYSGVTGRRADNAGPVVISTDQ